MRVAAARGKRAGNPGLRAADLITLRKLAAARDGVYLERLIAAAEVWLPAVRRLRAEGRPCETVVRYLNAHQTPDAPRWTQERLLRSVRRLAGKGMIDASLLTPVAPKAAPDRLLAVVAGIVLSEPKATLRAIGARLEALRERTPRGGAGWPPGPVAHVIARARKAGLLPPTVVLASTRAGHASCAVTFLQNTAHRSDHVQNERGAALSMRSP